MLSPHHIARYLRHNLSADWGLDSAFQWGKIGAVHVSPNTVDVYIEGSATLTTGLRYLASYAPAVNDAVLIGRGQGTSSNVRFVIGKLA